MADDMKDKIEAYAATLQAQVADKAGELMSWRPTSFDIASPDNFIPEHIDFNYKGETPTPRVTNLSAIPEPPTVTIPEISELSVVNTPEFNGSFEMAEVSTPEALPTRQFDVPDINIKSTPDAPNLENIASPVLSDVPIPPPINLSDLPVFTAVMPDFGTTLDLPYTDNPLAGFNTEVYKKRVYDSAELGTISTELQRDIVEGRTGIPSAVEAEIWNRQAERDLITLNDSIMELRKSYGKKGFPCPPDALKAAEARLRRDFEITRKERTREIAAKQAELTQGNRQFAINAALQLEQQHMQFAIQYAGLMLDVAKETVNAGIAIYNAHVAHMGIKLDIYKTQAAVYESQLRAFTTRIEAYRGELEAAKIRGELNAQQVDIYKARLAAQELLVRIFTARVEAVAAEAGVEKIKLDGFRAQIEAYQTEVQAKSSEFQAYEARLKGEVARAQVFESQLNAYRAQVEATSETNRSYAAKVQAEGLRASSVAEAAKVSIANYQAHIERFKAESLISLEEYKAEVQAFLAGLDLEKAKVSVEEVNSNVALKVWESQQNVVSHRAQVMVQQVSAENMVKKDAMQITSDVLRSIINSLSAVGIEIVRKTAT